MDSDLSDFFKYFRRYRKYKYNLKLIIENKISKKSDLYKYVPAIIGMEIDEKEEIIKDWMSLLKSEKSTIPLDKLEAISKLFNVNSRMLINTHDSKE